MKRLAILAVTALAIAGCKAPPDYFTEESGWAFAGEMMVFHDTPCPNPDSGVALVTSRNMEKGTPPETFCYRIDRGKRVAVINRVESGEHVVDLPLKYIKKIST